MAEKKLPQAEAITAVYNAEAYCDETTGNMIFDKKHTFFFKIRSTLLKLILENHEAVERPDGSVVIDGWRILS